MNERTRTRRSKLLSLLLRHQPEKIGLTLDEGGWADVDELLQKLKGHGKPMSLEVLLELVETSPKKRFALSDDGRRIRANQGHSVAVDLGYAESAPPARLYHGTVSASLPAIEQSGLSKMRRHHVHLSADVETATKVGQRRGKPVILVIDAAAMADAGYRFYVSDNGVWLTDSVPAEFLTIPISS